MLNLRNNRSLGKIELVTDEEQIRFLLEVTSRKTEYIPWQRKVGTVVRTYRIYDGKKTNKGITTYLIGRGWAAYLLNTFISRISKEEYDTILREVIYSDSFRQFGFPGLRDYQNEDVLHLLKYKYGLHSCFTGYGKTQVIATLTDYAYSMGESVLLVTPGKKAQDELVKRCKSAFGLDIPSKDGRLDCMITSGLKNRKDFKDPKGRAKIEEHISKFTWLLADEVEYTINDSGEFIYSCATGAKRMYGFSGTSDKDSAESITFDNGLSDVVLRNKDLIKFFGANLVYRAPVNKDINDIQIKTSALDLIRFDAEDFSDDGNVYIKVMSKIWTTPEICRLIVRIAKRYPLLFIPINNLANILTEWIDNWFIGTFRILLICGEGYIYYDIKGNRTKLTLSEACDYVKAGKVDIVPATSSGYRALDLPSLSNILLVEGLKAGVVLQSIGRIARSDHMNIITLQSLKGKKIPVYSKSDEARKDLYKTYYRHCKIVESEINEINL